MGDFFAPERTGATLQNIAKTLAVIAILTAVVGILLMIVLAFYGENISMWGGIIAGALAAEIFSCLLLHGFGVLVDSAYHQRLEAVRQTQLLEQLLAAQKPDAPADNAPAPARKAAEPQPKPAPVAAPKAPPAPEKSEPAKKTVDLVDVLGKALGYTDAAQRKEYLLSVVDQCVDEKVRAVCTKAVGMNDAQLIDLIAENG